MNSNRCLHFLRAPWRDRRLRTFPGIWFLPGLVALVLELAGCGMVDGGREAEPGDRTGSMIRTAIAPRTVAGETDETHPGSAISGSDTPEPEFSAMAAEECDRAMSEDLTGSTDGETATTADPLASLEETWGVKVMGVRLSAAGYMLDFRYRVTEPERAAFLFRRKTRPYLVDEASGARMAVPNPPKIGPLRALSKPEPNRQYFVLFSNPGAYLKKGSKVTVVIGDFRAEHLVVQ